MGIAGDGLALPMMQGVRSQLAGETSSRYEMDSV